MATIIAPQHACPIEDAAIIKKACVGWGTDEKAIISVLAHRNANQLRQIRQAYQDIYHEDLIHQLKSEISGDFEAAMEYLKERTLKNSQESKISKSLTASILRVRWYLMNTGSYQTERAMCHWVLDPHDREAVLANTALKRAIPDYPVILEIACTRSPEELLGVKRAYQLRYKHAFEEDVASYTTGKIRNFLFAVVSAYRYDGDEIDDKTAHSEAKTLHNEIQDSESNHEEIIRIISTRSKQQLKATFNHFKDIHGTSITRGLQGASNEFFAIIRVAIRCMKNPPKYFAKVLRNAIKGLGTDEDALTRAIVTRAEVDLKEIKELYKQRNNISLEEAIAGDTSGDYKAFLLALLGNE
ncbi:hypothetical protein Ancab_000176 [Ancistrocladus abbreviatus]